MENIKQQIKRKAREYLDDIIAIRRKIHANPELAFKEYDTARLVAAKLKEYGIEHQTGIAHTGVVGLIKGQNPEQQTFVLRADMDALPIAEENDVGYKSKNEGVMHACGHDVHTSSLLGTARILQDLKDHFEGTVKLLFQPSEEKYPGGALVMIREGVLENPKPAGIFGQHVYPELEAGQVGLRSGKYMASTDEVFLTVKGKGGHAALPYKNIDPVLVASHILVALQQLVSRMARPDMPTVLSFGRFIADGHTNIIPNEVKLAGILRTFDEGWRQQAYDKITQIAEGTAKAMGATCEIFIDRGYPYVFNDPALTKQAWDSAVNYLGQDNVKELDIRMTAEDFAYYSQEIPGCFYRLGIRNDEQNINSGLHTSTFNVDEKSLETGMGLMAYLALNQLTKNK
ncbi:MAG: amidohydrolase [Bacteroidales bacterium]|nr:amidohydrolase [Bacteroidales bacterium]